MRSAKNVQTFVIRNKQGQFLATYRAMSAKQAIQRFIDDQAVYASQFRYTSIISDVCASVEDRP